MDDCRLNNLEDGKKNPLTDCFFFTEASNLSVTKKSTLYYICRYVIYKKVMVCLDENKTVPLPKEAEFILEVARGKLKLPPLNFYDFSYKINVKQKKTVCKKMTLSRNANCCVNVYMLWLCSPTTSISLNTDIERYLNCSFS